VARAGKPWRWICDDDGKSSVFHLLDGQRRERATIWQNSATRFTWHTWNDRGTGGENSESTTSDGAKDSAVAALVRQGWAPGGWKVLWS